jgi:hypothetical protein
MQFFREAIDTIGRPLVLARLVRFRVRLRNWSMANMLTAARRTYVYIVLIIGPLAFAFNAHSAINGISLTNVSGMITPLMLMGAGLSILWNRDFLPLAVFFLCALSTIHIAGFIVDSTLDHIIFAGLLGAAGFIMALSGLTHTARSPVGPLALKVPVTDQHRSR